MSRKKRTYKKGNPYEVRAPRREKKTWTLKGLLRFLTNLLLVVTTALFVINYVGYRVKQEGYSMEPVIPHGSAVLVNRVWYHVKEPKRFELAACRVGTEESIQIKRVIGLPGETVQIKNGAIWINGQELTEAKAYTGTIDVAGRAANPVLLGEDEYFVLGDNTDRSQDSRFESVGNLSEKQLEGRAWFYIESVLSFGLLGE